MQNGMILVEEYEKLKKKYRIYLEANDYTD